MYCINCGRELDDGMKFCKYCGTYMGTEEQPVQQPLVVHKNPANKILMILLIIFCCVTIGSIGFTLYARSVSDESYYGQELTK